MSVIELPDPRRGPKPEIRRAVVDALACELERESFRTRAVLAKAIGRPPRDGTVGNALRALEQAGRAGRVLGLWYWRSEEHAALVLELEASLPVRPHRQRLHTNCVICESLLPKHRRLYCSDDCRRKAHAGTCIDCGGETQPTKRRTVSQRCRACATEHLGLLQARKAERRHQQIVDLWAEGLAIKEIASAIGWQANSTGSYICQLRAQGYDLPHRYNVAQSSGSSRA